MACVGHSILWYLVLMMSRGCITPAMQVATNEATPHFRECRACDYCYLSAGCRICFMGYERVGDGCQLNVIQMLLLQQLITYPQLNQADSMNYLKNSLRVKFRLTNPYQIRQQYALFPTHTEPMDTSLDPTGKQPKNLEINWQNNSPVHRVPSVLLAKNKINPDYSILRFGFKDPQVEGGLAGKCLGLKIGQYIWVEIDGVHRPYVPISRIDDSGFVDVLVRDMSRKNVASFTAKILGLEVGSSVNICGTGTQFLYGGHGKFKYMHPETNTLTQKVHKNIGIIAHSSAITTTYSLIESIATNFDTTTGVSLLWLGDQQSDFVFADELVSYVEQCKLNMNLMLMGMGVGRDWLGPYGRVMEDHIRDFMPFVGSREIIIMSGLEGELAYIPELVKKMGYKDYLNF